MSIRPNCTKFKRLRTTVGRNRHQSCSPRSSGFLMIFPYFLTDFLSQVINPNSKNRRRFASFLIQGRPKNSSWALGRHDDTWHKTCVPASCRLYAWYAILDMHGTLPTGLSASPFFHRVAHCVSHFFVANFVSQLLPHLVSHFVSHFVTHCPVSRDVVSQLVPLLSLTLSPTVFSDFLPALFPGLSPNLFHTLSCTLSPSLAPTVSPSVSAFYPFVSYLAPSFFPTAFPVLSPALFLAVSNCVSRRVPHFVSHHVSTLKIKMWPKHGHGPRTFWPSFWPGIWNLTAGLISTVTFFFSATPVPPILPFSGKPYMHTHTCADIRIHKNIYMQVRTYT